MTTKIADRLAAVLLVLTGFAFLGIYHPVDGAETVAIITIVVGLLNLSHGATLSYLEKFLAGTAPAGNSSAPSSSSSPGHFSAGSGNGGAA